jgi:hypothetical protein
MSKTPCQPRTLLAASTCDIQYCEECEMIHLMMGSMTLRLSEVHFKELARDLNKGLMQLTARTNLENGFRADNVTTLHS